MNNSNNSTTKPPLQDSDFRSQAVIIIQATLFAILGAIIVLGNLACIITFLKTQSLRRRSHYLIISLSVADLLVGLTELMFTSSVISGPKDNHFHVALNFVDTLTGHASIFTLMTINIERCYAVYYPFRHRLLTIRFYVVCVILPWLGALLISSPYLIAKFSQGIEWILALYLYQQAFFALVAVIIIVVTCICIFVKIKMSSVIAQNQDRALRERKLAVTLLLVTLASLVTWLPHQCWMFAGFLCSICGSIQTINYHISMKFLQYLNSGINVFIYIVKMPEFRKAFILVLFCKKEQSSPQNNEIILGQMGAKTVSNQTQSTNAGSEQS